MEVPRMSGQEEEGHRQERKELGHFGLLWLKWWIAPLSAQKAGLVPEQAKSLKTKDKKEN
jgi:hypothetical protein